MEMMMNFKKYLYALLFLSLGGVMNNATSQIIITDTFLAERETFLSPLQSRQFLDGHTQTESSKFSAIETWILSQRQTTGVPVSPSSILARTNPLLGIEEDGEADPLGCFTLFSILENKIASITTPSDRATLKTLLDTAADRGFIKALIKRAEMKFSGFLYLDDKPGALVDFKRASNLEGHDLSPAGELVTEEAIETWVSGTALFKLGLLCASPEFSGVQPLNVAQAKVLFTAAMKRNNHLAAFHYAKMLKEHTAEDHTEEQKELLKFAAGLYDKDFRDFGLAPAFQELASLRLAEVGETADTTTDAEAIGYQRHYAFKKGSAYLKSPIQNGVFRGLQTAVNLDQAIRHFSYAANITFTGDPSGTGSIISRAPEEFTFGEGGIASAAYVLGLLSKKYSGNRDLTSRLFEFAAARGDRPASFALFQLSEEATGTNSPEEDTLALRALQYAAGTIPIFESPHFPGGGFGDADAPHDEHNLEEGIAEAQHLLACRVMVMGLCMPMAGFDHKARQLLDSAASKNHKPSLFTVGTFLRTNFPTLEGARGLEMIKLSAGVKEGRIVESGFAPAAWELLRIRTASAGDTSPEEVDLNAKLFERAIKGKVKEALDLFQFITFVVQSVAQSTGSFA